MQNLAYPHYKLRLTSKWVDTAFIGRAMRNIGEVHHRSVESVEITLGCGCGVLIDGGMLLLSLANQLANSGRSVTLRFEDGPEGVMGYFDRLAFFDLLDPAVKIVPDRPARSASSIYAGTNPNVVEFQQIRPDSRDKTTPSVLADAVETACKNRADCQTLGHAAFTVFGELIDNIYEHSETEVDGFAALQVYRRNNSVVVAVSDSGKGLLETLRPSLAESPLCRLSDSELIVEVLNNGMSRLQKDHPERGAGLCQSADHALKFRAHLTLRLSTSGLKILPDTSRQGIYDGRAICDDGLPVIHGTHIAFRFHLLTKLN